MRGTSATSSLKQRRALYEGARILVLPSLEEGFGIPVLEAMTVGVPVVASRRGALPEVLDGAGVLVDPLDAADLAAGLARILDDAPVCRRVCDARHRSLGRLPLDRHRGASLRGLSSGD